MSRPLCLDAGVLLKAFVAEPDSELAATLLDEADANDLELVGPSFLLAEAASVLRRHVQRNTLSSDLAEAALDSLLELPIQQDNGSGVYRRAWEIAKELQLAVIYDSVYLAVAELRGATFWTADRKLFEKARGKGYVRLLGAQVP